MKKIAVIFGGIALIGVMAATIFLQKGTNLQGYLKAALPTLTCTFTGAGAVPTDWNIDANWSCRRVPTIEDAVIIPDYKTVMVNEDPAIANPREAYSLTIGVKAILNVKNDTLTISEATINKGIINIFKDASILFGLNFPDSTTKNAGSLNNNDGNMIFYNNFLNEYDFDNRGFAAFQRNLTQTIDSFSSKRGTISFFGGYEQNVRTTYFSTHKLSIDKEPRTSVNIDDTLMATQEIDLNEIHLNSGVLRTGKNTIDINHATSSGYDPLIKPLWENAGGEFEGTGNVSFAGCTTINGSGRFNRMTIHEGGCIEGGLNIEPINSNIDIATNTIEIKKGKLRLNGNNLEIRGSGTGDKRPLISTSSGIDTFEKGNVIFSASAPTELTGDTQYYDLTFTGTGPYTFKNLPLITTRIVNRISVDAASTVNIADGHNLQVDGPINNDGLINVGVGSQFIHPAEYVTFTDVAGTKVFEYTAPTRVYIEIKDTNRNLDGTMADNIEATLVSESGGVLKDGETILLIETEPNTGIFRGKIDFLNDTPTVENGLLEMDDFGSTRVTYTDIYDATDVKTDFVPLNLPDVI